MPSVEHELNVELWLPRPRDELFPFFAEARNLERITPPWLSFKVLTADPIVMRVGALIDYQIRLRGLPLRWRTEITVWKPPGRFADTQVRGPYRQWIHEHRFEERDGGTLCVDHVRYLAPGGELLHRWFVRPDVERIFRFRQARLRELFGSPVVSAKPGTEPTTSV
jgi:ligand-binding SRPBCC domain-containing protein